MTSDPKSLHVGPRDSRAVSRRNFLTFGVGAIASLIAAAFGIPLAGYAVSPAFRKGEIEWIEVAGRESLKVGEPQKAEYTLVKKDGWVEETVRKTVWVVVAADKQTVTVYDPRCTHLGCAYSWQADRKRFFCPCHDGVFDVDGRVIGGPPPRPLDRYETRVEGGKLYIGRMYSVDSNLNRTT